MGVWTYLSVDASLVSKRTEASNGVVKRNVDFDALGDNVLELLELLELVA